MGIELGNKRYKGANATKANQNFNAKNLFRFPKLGIKQNNCKDERKKGTLKGTIL